ncbi:MAG: hypothetical protein GY873_13725 [Bosea sp.]|uniref:hypothetical protein n=1 Tax=Bosea sp. (in: a-proteobacteria) TaxID=1871050 RepID=UPI0023A58FEB|nr:hypothetical protein [Bosea sp. (in: a-proteobacteria)]MCP4735239.1 hypothetical protein [Bosea sp. (in: a-proteobacteria)]
MTTKTTGADSARPEDHEMRLYARAYASPQSADSLFLKWEAAHAHAMLLDESPERLFSDYGLNGRQLAEGARIAARRMALLMAETPTTLREVLALKVHAYETMGQVEGEVARSHAVIMVEAAMKADAERLNIVLLPLDQPFGRTQ